MGVYQGWQLKLERQPVNFIVEQLPILFRRAREALAGYLTASLVDLVFIPNATFCVNVVAWSLGLHHGNEILSTDHEYGACDRAWDFICKISGAKYIRQPLPLPMQSSEELVEEIWSGMTTRNKLIFISHITNGNHAAS